MATILKSLILAVLLSGSAASFAQTFTKQSTIKISAIRTGCLHLTDPYIEADIFVNGEDQGLPGIFYIGTIDQYHTQAYFFAGGGWHAYSSGNIPPYLIMANGLTSTTVRLYVAKLPSFVAGDKHIYFGYGALTPASERMVQASISAVQRLKEKFPDRKPSPVEPDNFRLALIQDNMTKNAKYQFAISSQNFPECVLPNPN